MSPARKIRESGVAAVELALVTPILLALIFGIVEFGMLWSFKAQLNNATATANRAFILDSDSANPSSTAKAIITGSVRGVSASDVTICLNSAGTTNCANPKCTDATSGGKVTVTVLTPRTAVTKILPGSINVRSEFVALCQ